MLDASFLNLLKTETYKDGQPEREREREHYKNIETEL